MSCTQKHAGLRGPGDSCPAALCSHVHGGRRRTPGLESERGTSVRTTAGSRGNGSCLLLILRRASVLCQSLNSPLCVFFPSPFVSAHQETSLKPRPGSGLALKSGAVPSTSARRPPRGRGMRGSQDDAAMLAQVQTRARPGATWCCHGPSGLALPAPRD